MNIKRVWALLLSVMLLVQMVPAVSAAPKPTITIESAAAQPGEEVSLKVTAQNFPAVSAIMIVPEYDDSVLELLSGTWLVSGQTADNWNPAFNDAVILFNGNTMINGDIFEWKFHVKEDASIGASAKVSSVEFTVQVLDGNHNVAVDFALVDGSVEVVCLHEEKVEAPEKAPFCLEAGNHRYYTCGCGAVLKSDGITPTTVEAETIPALGHDWSDATCTQARTCKRPNCSATEGASLGHLWTQRIEDSTHLRRAAENCTEFNTYWFDCARCNAVSQTEYFTGKTAGPHIFTEKIEDAAHQVAGSGANCQDAKVYYYDCAYCDLMGQDTFVGQSMGQHQMSADWTSENDKHFHECSIDGCTYIEDEENCSGGTATCLAKAVCRVCKKEYGRIGDHTLTHHSRNEADHTKPGNVEYWTCDLCGKYFSDSYAENEITAKDTVIAQIPHSHSASWSQSTTQHWNECSCGDKINVGDHGYDNSCDTTCNTCGWIREDAHSFDQEWSHDRTHHWHTCGVCGEVADMAEHSLILDTECAICGTLYLLGDMNGDWVVDNKDVEHLLWHTLFPDNHPLNQSGDVDKSGTVDNKDVEYLLWHTLFPDSHPLT